MNSTADCCESILLRMSPMPATHLSTSCMHNATADASIPGGDAGAAPPAAASLCSICSMRTWILPPRSAMPLAASPRSSPMMLSTLAKTSEILPSAPAFWSMIWRSNLARLPVIILTSCAADSKWSACPSTVVSIPRIHVCMASIAAFTVYISADRAATVISGPEAGAGVSYRFARLAVGDMAVEPITSSNLRRGEAPRSRTRPAMPPGGIDIANPSRPSTGARCGGVPNTAPPVWAIFSTMLRLVLDRIGYNR